MQYTYVNTNFKQQPYFKAMLFTIQSIRWSVKYSNYSLTMFSASFIKKCKRNDPQLNECMREAIMTSKPHIRKGLKELRIPNLDPYTVSSTILSTSWMNCTLTNLTADSLYDYTTESVKFDLKNDTELIVATLFPRNTFRAHYVLDGKILQFVLHGEGEVEMRVGK